MMNITVEQANTLRQWFDSLLDTNPSYLETKDFEMAIQLYKLCGMRVPHNISKHVIILPDSSVTFGTP